MGLEIEVKCYLPRRKPSLRGIPKNICPSLTHHIRCPLPSQILFLTTFLCSLLSRITGLLGFPLTCCAQLCLYCFVCLEIALPRYAPDSPLSYPTGPLIRERCPDHTFKIASPHCHHCPSLSLYPSLFFFIAFITM